MFKYSFIFVVILGLFACDKLTQKNATTVENSQPAASEKIIEELEVPEKKPLELSIFKVPEKKLLDLSIPKVHEINLGETFAFPDKKILPDFFKSQKKEKNTVLSARLLIDPSNPDYIDSLEGAEVTVEIKLN